MYNEHGKMSLFQILQEIKKNNLKTKSDLMSPNIVYVQRIISPTPFQVLFGTPAVCTARCTPAKNASFTLCQDLVLTQPLNWHTTSLLDLRSPDGTGHLSILLFSFQFSFFLWIKLGLFLLLPFAFVFFPLVTHLCFSFLKNELRRTVGPKPRLLS
jgi:hypothetical protein